MSGRWNALDGVRVWWGGGAEFQKKAQAVGLLLFKLATGGVFDNRYAFVLPLP